VVLRGAAGHPRPLRDHRDRDPAPAEFAEAFDGGFDQPPPGCPAAFLLRFARWDTQDRPY
jgi:hypothetical protein